MKTVILAGLVLLVTGCASLQPYTTEGVTREEVSMMQTMTEMRQGFQPDGL